MSTPSPNRFKAYLQFILAVIWFFFARFFAHSCAVTVANERFLPLVEVMILLGALIIGYTAFTFWFDRQFSAVRQQGWPLRAGWPREVGLGLALGWALAVACVLPMALFSGIALSVNLQLGSWGWLLADLLYFAVLAAVEEVALRGYGFQRLASALSGTGAAVAFSVVYLFLQSSQPGERFPSLCNALLLNLLLSMAYLRTRALWVSWGLNFAWKASRALLFGLAVSGDDSHSPVIQGDPLGSYRLSGGGYGLEASWMLLLALLAMFFVLYKATRELDFVHNAPVIEPGGFPMDVESGARKQHDEAMVHSEPKPPALIQILPVQPIQTEFIPIQAPPSIAKDPSSGDH